MYDDGYHNITNIDFSETVIENMRLRCKDKTRMTCKPLMKKYFLCEIIIRLLIHKLFEIGIVMDIRDLNFLDRTFDIVIDKGVCS